MKMRPVDVGGNYKKGVSFYNESVFKFGIAM